MNICGRNEKPKSVIYTFLLQFVFFMALDKRPFPVPAFSVYKMGKKSVNLIGLLPELILKNNNNNKVQPKVRTNVSTPNYETRTTSEIQVII